MEPALIFAILAAFWCIVAFIQGARLIRLNHEVRKYKDLFDHFRDSSSKHQRISEMKSRTAGDILYDYYANPRDKDQEKRITMLLSAIMTS